MAVVSKAVYESLAEKIGSAYAAQASAAPYIASGLSEVVNLDDADQEYDLLYAFYQAEADKEHRYLSTANFVSLATALQTHVELRSGKTITQFLTDNNIKVSKDFAAVSKDAGWNIDAFIA